MKVRTELKAGIDIKCPENFKDFAECTLYDDNGKPIPNPD